MKQNLQTLIVGWVIGLSALGLTSTAKAEDPVGTINCDFRKVVEMQNTFNGQIGNSKILESYLAPDWSSWDNLKIRTDYNDASGNSDAVVSKTGYRDTTTGTWVGEKWDVGFFKHLPSGGIQFGAYASTDNSWSNRYPTFLGGRLQGRMYVDTFPVGTRPDDLIIIHDRAGDGSVKLVPNGVNSYILQIPTDESEENKPYFFRDLIINGKRGDTSELTPYLGPSPLIIPPMVISPYEEIPAENRGAKATYFEGIREGKSGTLDLLMMAENWLQSCGPENYHCGGQDWNTDGKVDNKDFVVMAAGWDEEGYLNP
jgi:hypothetical protein